MMQKTVGEECSRLPWERDNTMSQRKVTLSGSPVQLTAIEYRMLAELVANAGRALTYEQLLKGSGAENNGDLRPCGRL